MADSSTSQAEESEYAGRNVRRSVRQKRPKMSLDFEDIGTDSPASVSDEEEVQTVPHRGRGKCRGRGRGRGRGGRRGGRLYRGQRFEEDEEERLVQLHEERKERADEMIESMTEAEAKTMLKEVAARQPAVILDIAALLSKRQQPQPENPEEPMPGGSQAPSWCICLKCPAMDRDEDKVCCGMSPQYCNSLRPEMGLVVTDPLTLHIQQTFRNDVFAHQAETLEDTNKAMRHAAYRQYVLWIFGRLQKDDRRTVPACCVKVIRNRFPSLSGHYTGFIPGRGVGW